MGVLTFFFRDGNVGKFTGVPRPASIFLCERLIGSTTVGAPVVLSSWGSDSSSLCSVDDEGRLTFNGHFSRCFNSRGITSQCSGSHNSLVSHECNTRFSKAFRIEFLQFRYETPRGGLQMKRLADNQV